MSVLYELTPSVQLGLGLSQFRQAWNNGVVAVDNRAQLTGWFVF